jgi:methionyl-tRNA synthetase
VGYGSSELMFDKWWPASVHLLGKDILTTHSVYWSTMLFSLGLPLPEKIFAHGWWLVEETKMSKSLGNVINPLDLIDRYGVDSVRYFLMREMILGQDANFSLDLFVKRYNSDLANDFGNLLNRVGGLIGKNFDKRIPAPGHFSAEDEEIISFARDLHLRVKEYITRFSVHEAIEEVLKLVRLVNGYLEKQAPWKVAKTDLPRAGTILYVATESLRITTILLSAVMPAKTRSVLDILGATDTLPIWGQLKVGVELKTHDALFPRIEQEKK